MKITLAGVPGSGKSTLRQAISEKYNLSVKGTGDFVRSVAQKRGYSDITKFLEEVISNDPKIDLEIDEEQKKFGEDNDNFVLDAHLGFLFVPDSIKLLLLCSPETAAERIFNAKRTTEDARNIQESIHANQRRINSMKKNFKKLYNVDMHEESQFDLVVDTTYLTPQEVLKKITDFIDSQLNNAETK